MNIEFSISGMHCGSCAARITKGLKEHPQISDAHVNLPLNMGRIEGSLSRDELVRLVRGLGYEASFDHGQDDFFKEEEVKRKLQKQELVAAVLVTTPVFVLGMGWLHFPGQLWVQAILTTIVLFYFGRQIFHTAFQLATKGQLNMDSLVAVGTLAAWVFSFYIWTMGDHHVYFESAAVIITLILFGRYLEERAKGKASEAIRKLMQLKPQRALRIQDDGTEKDVAASSLIPGDLFLVRAGEKVPADGDVVSGQTECDEAMVTGESFPALKGQGSTVIGGTLNIGQGVLKVRSTKGANETLLAQMISIVQQAQLQKIKMQTLADQIALVFVPIVFGIAILTFVAWFFLVDGSIAQALIPAVSVLVIACPCALGLATPAAIVAATGKAAEHGILVRSAPGFEMMRKLAALVFDKTGTLTESKPTVVKSVVVDHEKSALILQFCYSLASKSTHPLAVAVAKSLQEKDYRAMEVEDLAEKPGRGMSGQVDGRSIFFGNQAWLSENGIDISESLALVPGEADLVVFAGWDGLAQVAFILTDPIRENTKVAIDRLKSLGLKTIVASGDRHAVVQLMAKNLDIDEAYGGLSPLEKSELISKLKSQYGLVGMVGDGINDAAAMAQADVAIAMGSGSDAALAAADMVLLKGDLMKVVDSLSLSHRTIAVIQQNLFWAFCYNILAIPIAAAGYLSPMVASGAMAFSSLSVVLNSLRLRYRDL